MLRVLVFCTLLLLVGFPQREPDARSAKEFEVRQTEKLLGVRLRNFPEPQGVEGFDSLPANAPTSQFTVKQVAIRPAPVNPDYSARPFVKAKAPDGSIYEGYSGREQQQVSAGHWFNSNAGNTRQMYGTHHGYGYNPQDVYIGKRVDGRIRPELFFRDVGSHDAAPFHFAVDSRGMVHLIVADVNISQNNELDLYWVVGDPRSGKWTAAWLIDHRGFTFSSKPWSGAWGDKVNMLWHWDAPGNNDKHARDVGIFFVQWSSTGFGRKERVIEETPFEWDATVDPRTGRIFLIYSTDTGVWVTSRPEGGSWMRPSRVPDEHANSGVFCSSTGDGGFIIKTRFNQIRQSLLRPLN